MKSKHSARKIHARSPWVAHPEAYSAPQQPAQVRREPAGASVRRVAPGNDITASYRAGRAQGTLAEPSIAAADHEHGVTIRIDGHRYRVPEGVEMAFSHSQGRDIVYLSRPAHSIVALVSVRGVGVRELKGIPLDILTDLRQEHFPKAGR